MAQRHYSPQDLAHNSQSIQKERKLREVGSTSALRNSKQSNFLEEGETVGHYNYSKKDEIGSGYTSRVYKCRSLKDEGLYAIKVIDLKKYSASSLEMLENQIQILRMLNHPNVLQFKHVYRTGTHCFLVTEYCPLGDLLEYITRMGRLTEIEATSIMGEVIQGLKYLFRIGILHRDIKPANILKGAKNWKLCDFGFSMEASEEVKTRHNVGTPLYMPLESLVRNLYSPQSDIFAVGVILYQLIVGVTPWECRSQKQLIKKMSTIPFNISEKYKVSSHLKYLLAKMCAVEKSDRMAKEEFMELNLNNFVSLNNFNEMPTKSDRPKVEKRRASGQYQPKKVHTGKGESAPKIERKSNVIVQYNGKRKVSVESRGGKNNPKTFQTQTYRTVSKKSSRSGGSSQKKFESKLDQKNYQVLISQLNYCRFLYYMVENGCYLPLSNGGKAKLCLVAFKHLLKTIKQLGDSRINWFGFTNWDHFRKSEKYEFIYKTMRQYCQKYQKQYLVFLKRADIVVIKEINQKFPEFGNNQPFSIAFYRKLLTFLSPLIRQSNHSITTSMPSINEQKLDEKANQQNMAKLEGIKSLYRYYQLVDLSIHEYQNYSHFERFSDITVIKNYRKTSIQINEYLKIRQDIKLI